MNNKYLKKASSIALDKRSIDLRLEIIKAVEKGKRAHLGSAFSIIEILRVLYDSFLNITPKKIKSISRDRFILSKGHGCLALYALLADKKYINKKDLYKFCSFDSFLGGHPEHHIPGVEASTGALGHGMSIGVGMAISSKIKKLKNKIIVLLGDGEINEGSCWEAAMSASKHKLHNLIILIDYNKIQSYGFVRDVLDLEPLNDKWKSFGFNTYEINGHDTDQLLKTFYNLKKNYCPHVIICHTVKGKGLKFAENQPSWHHKNNLSTNEINQMYLNIKCEKLH